MRQAKAQLVPSQVAALAPVGTGQAVQEVPQELVLLLSTQIPEQLCVPIGHRLEQAWAFAMQDPRQSFWSLGQVPPQAPCTQVAVPPAAIGHGVQDVPQLETAVSLTQLPPQR